MYIVTRMLASEVNRVTKKYDWKTLLLMTMYKLKKSRSITESMILSTIIAKIVAV
jgi:hypothetical protein